MIGMVQSIVSTWLGTGAVLLYSLGLGNQIAVSQRLCHPSCGSPHSSSSLGRKWVLQEVASQTNPLDTAVIENIYQNLSCFLIFLKFL